MAVAYGDGGRGFMVYPQKEIAMATVTGARLAINPQLLQPLEAVKVEAYVEPDKISSNGKTEVKNGRTIDRRQYWLYAAVGAIVLYWLLKK